MPVTGRVYLTIVKQTARAIGVELPADIAERITKAEEVTAAAEALPSDDLDNLAAVKAAGVQAFYHLGNAQHAIKLWTAAIKGFQQIAAAARITVNNKRLILTAADPGTLPADPWLFARNGVPLSLPTLGGYMERVVTQQAHVSVIDDEDQAEHKQPRTAVLT